PRHPYTRALLSAVPIPDPVVEATRERIGVRGEVPSALARPAGCPFHPRCPIAVADCAAGVPPLREVGGAHWAACIRAWAAGAPAASRGPPPIETTGGSAQF